MPELPFLLGKVRKLTQEFKKGGSKSLLAFEELVSFLLHLTVIRKDAQIQLYFPQPGATVAILGGSPIAAEAIPLNNGHYLRLTMTLFVDRKMKRLKVEKSSYQYQLEPAKTNQWVFRYDYLREPGNLYPASHLHINAQFTKELDFSRGCPGIHFPTGRVSVEAVIRLLVDQLGVKSNDSKNWRDILAESERLFHEIAHQPLSCPKK